MADNIPHCSGDAHQQQLHYQVNASRAPATQLGLHTPGMAGNSEQLQLRLTHECKGFGCADLECKLCKNIELRRCCSTQSPLLPKYVTKEVLQAKCGGSLAVQVVNQAGAVCDVQGNIEVSLAIPEDAESLLEDVKQPTRQQLLPLLTEEHAPKALRLSNTKEQGTVSKITLQLQGGQASLSDLSCDTSLLSGNHAGKSCHFKFVITCPGNDSITPYISSTFDVVHPRSKKAQKPTVLRCSDPVSNLHGFAKGTGAKEGSADKLAALRQKLEEQDAAAAGLLPPELSSISTVAQFLALYNLLKTNNILKTALVGSKRLFKSADWERAAAHAATAVSPDEVPRVWWVPQHFLAQQQQQQQQQRVGLLYPCKKGRVLLQHPVALVERPAAAAAAAAAAAVVDSVRLLDQPLLPALLLAAEQDWSISGHSNWDIYSAELPALVAAAAAAGQQQQQQQQQQQLSPAQMLNGGLKPHMPLMPAAAASSHALLLPQYQQQQHLSSPQVCPAVYVCLPMQPMLLPQQQQQHFATAPVANLQPVLLPMPQQQQQQQRQQQHMTSPLVTNLQPVLPQQQQQFGYCVTTQPPVAPRTPVTPAGQQQQQQQQQQQLPAGWAQQQQQQQPHAPIMHPVVCPADSDVAEEGSLAAAADGQQQQQKQQQQQQQQSRTPPPDPFGAAAVSYVAMLDAALLEEPGAEAAEAAAVCTGLTNQQQQQQGNGSLVMMEGSLVDYMTLSLEQPAAAAAAAAAVDGPSGSLDQIFKYLDQSETLMQLAGQQQQQQQHHVDAGNKVASPPEAAAAAVSGPLESIDQIFQYLDQSETLMQLAAYQHQQQEQRQHGMDNAIPIKQQQQHELQSVFDSLPGSLVSSLPTVFCQQQQQQQQQSLLRTQGSLGPEEAPMAAAAAAMDTSLDHAQAVRFPVPITDNTDELSFNVEDMLISLPEPS